MEKIDPLTVEYNVLPEDNRVVFPFIDRTGEMLVLIPKSKFEIVDSDGATIILREINNDKPPF